MKLYRTAKGPVAEDGGKFVTLADDWDTLINRDDLAPHLRSALADRSTTAALPAPALAPIGSQEVWAAGVTYYRSRAARVEESKGTGAATFYDKVYEAERPELFFKAAPWRVCAPGGMIRIRRDATWSVPEPELALYLNARGDLVGYTIGNDVSSRDIEGENPLYLPQAKIYDGSCSLGPALLVTGSALPAETAIEMTIRRSGAVVFQGATTLAGMKRPLAELAAYLFRETSFPRGCVLLTGTGVVPEDHFTLASGDEVDIVIAPIGTLTNRVE